MRLARRRQPWTFCIAAAVLAACGFVLGRHAFTFQLGGVPAAGVASLPADPAFDGLSPAARADVEGLILAQRKRVMGRMRSLEMVRRVATTVRPLVDRAAEMPSVQRDFDALAASARMSVPDYREYFKDKQEADLLLESGGDPSARSVSNAIGVAQFMPGTGRRRGLKVDLPASNALSRKIGRVEAEISALAERPDDWTRTAGGTVWSRDLLIARRRSLRADLLRKRRRVDERFDPVKSIRAQTRYLLRLTRRYGGIDWALQAYHGGEGGASRTMRLFAYAPSGRSLLASRGAGFNLWLPYAELYRGVSPSATPAAFNYLYGRSDDHRYYWWKVLMAERALELYRRDPAEFERQWRSLQPGVSSDAQYYPDPTPLQFADSGALQEAYRDGLLVSLPSNAAALGMRTANIAVLDPASSNLHKGLRPEAMGALLRLLRVYRSHGGRAPLTLTAMVRSNAYCDLWDARYPDPPLHPSVPVDPEYHSTGLAFDLQIPPADWDRKVLQYALGRLYDTLRITWRPERDAGTRRYHVTVNPEFKDEMEQYYRQAMR